RYAYPVDLFAATACIRRESEPPRRLDLFRVEARRVSFLYDVFFHIAAVASVGRSESVRGALKVRRYECGAGVSRERRPNQTKRQTKGPHRLCQATRMGHLLFAP